MDANVGPLRVGILVNFVSQKLTVLPLGEKGNGCIANPGFKMQESRKGDIIPMNEC